MSTFYRKFEITEEDGASLIFKHYPETDVISTEEDNVDASLKAREDLVKLIKVASRFLSDNTMCKVEIVEGTEE